MIVFPVLTAHERERLYDESKVLARLFGIPEDQLPQTLPTIWRSCMPQTYLQSAQTRVSWPTGFSPAPLLGCARRDGIARLPHDSCRNACVKRSDLNTVVQSNVLPTRRSPGSAWPILHSPTDCAALAPTRRPRRDCRG